MVWQFSNAVFHKRQLLQTSDIYNPNNVTKIFLIILPNRQGTLALRIQIQAQPIISRWIGVMGCAEIYYNDWTLKTGKGGSAGTAPLSQRIGYVGSPARPVTHPIYIGVIRPVNGV